MRKQQKQHYATSGNLSSMSVCVKADARAIAGAGETEVNFESVVDAVVSDFGGINLTKDQYDDLVCDARIAFNDARTAME